MPSNARRSRSCVRWPYPACSSATFEAPCRSRAIAVHTHESIPPLNSTTALRESVIKPFFNRGALELASTSPRILCVFFLPGPLKHSKFLLNLLLPLLPLLHLLH